MIFLLLSISLSVLTVSFFKLFERYNVPTFQAIIVNYATCIIVGNLFADEAIITRPFWSMPWFPYAALLGGVFISIFYSIGLTSQRMGVSVSMVAAKLSVVIPVGIAFLFQGESLNIFKVTGIVLSLLSVYLISKKESVSVAVTGKSLWILPLIVFAGSGIIDAMLRFMQQRFIPPATAGDMISTVFLAALCYGLIVVLIRKEKFQPRSIWWGIALGIPNYFCMYFLVRTLEQFDATFIFPLNNIAIVVCSTLVSMLFFSEKLSRSNWAGFALAILSILIISLADVVL
jgi:drug/metabolite transporter (DMT)-like permease